jgi:cysteine-rich repeat protein
MKHLDELFPALRCKVLFLLVTVLAAAAGACLDRPDIQACDNGLCPAGWSCSSDGDCQPPTGCVVATAESHFIGADGNGEDDGGSIDRRSDEDRGDSTLDQGEEGNDDSTKNGGVSILATCGDGVIDDDEECDDGNAVAGDGCSASCQEEFGYDCVLADLSKLDDDHIPNESDPIPPAWETRDASTVTQTTVDTDPAVYLTNLPATDSGEIQLQVSVDPLAPNEDYIGIVLGYDSDELSRVGAEYLLIDWHGESNAQGTGLTLSLVKGQTNAYDLVQHAGTVTLLRSLVPGPGAPKYWQKGKAYVWTLRYSETRITLTIEEGIQQAFALDIVVEDVADLVAFPTGNLGFYVYGQDHVMYNLLSPRGRSICVFDDGDSLSGAADDDEDNDGIPDVLENVETIDPDDDRDRNGVCNYRDADDRGDGTGAVCPNQDGNEVCDELDPLFDVDEDSQPNHRDLDADGDTIPDLVESGHDGSDDDENGHVDGPVGDNGIPDQVESMPDSGLVDAPWNTDVDVDTAPDFLDEDSDADNIRDADEAGDGDLTTAPVNTDDDDGIPDFRDLDSDGDTISDKDEAGDGALTTAPVNTNYYDNDTPDFRDLDSDGDTISDKDEAGDGALTTAPVDTDEDGTPDFRDLDSDDDGIADWHEASDGDLFIAPVDTDEDGTPDFRDLDSDDDGIADWREAGDGNLVISPVDRDEDGTPDFRDLDSDGDEIGDGADNCRLSVNPDQQDLDRDRVGDVCDCTVGQGGCSSVDSSGAGAVLLVLLALAPSAGRRKRRPWLRARHRRADRTIRMHTSAASTKLDGGESPSPPRRAWPDPGNVG